MSKHRGLNEKTKPQTDENTPQVDVKKEQKPPIYIRQICKSNNGMTVLSIGKLLRDYGLKHWEIVRMKVINSTPDTLTIELTKLQ